MLTVVGVDTGLVVTVKVALVAPAATVTLVGTVAAAESSESDTAAPPAGAAALKVTTPVEEAPPTTLAGLTDKAERVGPGGGGGGVIPTPNLATNPSPQKIWGSPSKTVSKAAGVIGKLAENV